MAGVILAACLAACSGTTSPQTPAAGAPSPSADVSATGTPSPSPSAGPRNLTLVATGDVLLHEPLWEQARRDGGGRMDFRPLLAGIRPVVEAADLAVCHLETPLAPAGGPYRGYPSFAGPPQIVPALRATGYDACTTASNHTFDAGAAGVDRTLDALDAAGIAHAGSARTTREAARTTILPVNGVRVALLSYTYGFNGVPYPGGDRWRAHVLDVDRILADARRARSRGAEIVVLALHWGTEYQHEPNADQRRIAPRLARSPDIDLVLGHHAHVVQPVERIGRTWVVYGLGNMVAHHGTPVPANAEGLLVRFTFTERASGRFAVTTAEYTPLLVAREPPIRLLDVPVVLAGGDRGGASTDRLRAALTRTTRVVHDLGAAEDGLAPVHGAG